MKIENGDDIDLASELACAGGGMRDNLIYCATGHRPNKLGGYGTDIHEGLIHLACSFLGRTAPDKIISGMALGWDLAWAEAGILSGIPVVAAIPFTGQEGKWPKYSQDYYNDTLDKCSEVVIVSEGGYASWKMQVRNKWMVDNSNGVVALWDGSEGGTGNCIKYATKKDTVIHNLWGEYENRMA